MEENREHDPNAGPGPEPEAGVPVGPEGADPSRPGISDPQPGNSPAGKPDPDPDSTLEPVANVPDPAASAEPEPVVVEETKTVAVEETKPEPVAALENPGPQKAADAAPEPDAASSKEEAATTERGGGGKPTPLWFAIRVQSNKEDSVKRNLESKIKLRGLGRKISQVVVPTEKIAEIKNGRKRTRQVKTYPGYVLLEMLMDDETWSFVRETPGVGDFVGGGGTAHQKPFPLLPDEVSKIFGQDLPDEATPKIKIDFAMGDKVKIREGPFENFDGVVEEINEHKGIVRVVVTIFGRSTPVELQYWQVEPI